MSDLPGSTRIGRVGLAVDDLARTSRFYRRVVGLEPGQRTDGRATFGAGERTLLELRASPEEPPRPDDAAGLFHVAYRLPSRAALATALGQVRNRWRLDGASDHLVSEALYLGDPGDNGVELYRDRARERWEQTPGGGVRIDTLPLDLDDLSGDADTSADANTSADSSPNGTVPAGTDVGHVHLEVTDLGRTRAFYVDALGFEERFRTRGGLFVAAGGYHHHLGLNTWYERSEPASGRGLDWFELVLPGRDALEATLDRLEDAGYGPESIEGGATVEDPDEIEVRLAVEE